MDDKSGEVMEEDKVTGAGRSELLFILSAT